MYTVTRTQPATQLRLVEVGYDPAAELPVNHIEYQSWLQHWSPIWQKHAEQEQRDAGAWHYEHGLPIESCSSDAAKRGWMAAALEASTQAEALDEEYAHYLLCEEEQAQPVAGIRFDDLPSDEGIFAEIDRLEQWGRI
jgi:hypothetical protein